MATQASLDTIQKLFIAYYNRPADSYGLRAWADALEMNGGDQSTIIDSFATSDEATALFPNGITTANIDTVLEQIFQSLFNRSIDPDGLTFYKDLFGTGTGQPGEVSVARLALVILDGAGDTGTDAWTLKNKLNTANQFTKIVDGRSFADPEFGLASGVDGNGLPTGFAASYNSVEKIAAARDMLKNVNSSTGSLMTEAAMKAFVQTQIASPGDPLWQGGGTGAETITLTEGADNFVGSASKDTTFVGNKDTFTVGDSVDGGAGNNNQLIVDFQTNQAKIPVNVQIERVQTLRTSTTSSVDLDVTPYSSIKEVSSVSGGGKVEITGGEKVTSTGGDTTASFIQGKDLKEVTVKNFGLAGDSVAFNIDNLDSTSAPGQGTSLKKVVLDKVITSGNTKVSGKGLTDVAVKNFTLETTAADNGIEVAGVDGTSFNLALDNVGYDNGGNVFTSKFVGFKLSGGNVSTLNIDSSGQENNIVTSGSNGKEKTLNLTGDANLKLDSLATLATLETIDGSTATGDLDLGALAASVKTVKTGAGKDKVTLAGGFAATSTVDLGAGDDVLSAVGGAVADASSDTAGKIDGGAGVNTLKVLPLMGGATTAAKAKRFWNFHKADVNSGSAVTFNMDHFENTKSSIDTLLFTKTTTGSSVTNLANSTNNIIISGGITTNTFTASVKNESATKLSTYNIEMNNHATDNDVLTFSSNYTKTINVNSTGDTATTANKLTLSNGVNSKYQEIYIKGDKDFTLKFAAGGAAGNELKKIDGSAATGKLDVDLANISESQGFEVKGGSGDDKFTTKAGISAKLTGGAGNDSYVVSATAANATTANNAHITTITDFTSGDVLNFGVSASVSLGKISLGSSVNSLDAAFALTKVTTNKIQWFNYADDTYVIWNEADGVPNDKDGLTSGDIVVKLTGTHTFTAGTVDQAAVQQA